MQNCYNSIIVRAKVDFGLTQDRKMNAEKMTQKAMEALEAAHADAVRKGNPEITTLHL